MVTFHSLDVDFSALRITIGMEGNHITCRQDEMIQILELNLAVPVAGS